MHRRQCILRFVVFVFFHFDNNNKKKKLAKMFQHMDLKCWWSQTVIADLLHVWWEVGKLLETGHDGNFGNYRILIEAQPKRNVAV